MTTHSLPETLRHLDGLTLTRRTLADIDTSVMIRTGSLPPIVFLHGLIGQSEIWLSTARYLNSEHALFIPDLVGRGETGIASGLDVRNVYRVMVAQVCALLDEWELQDVTLVGSSLGALIAGLVALERPDQVSRLVLANSELISNPNRKISASNSASIPRPRIFEPKVSIDDTVGYLARNVVDTSRLDPAFILALFRTLNRSSSRHAMSLIAEMVRSSSPLGRDSFLDRAGEVSAATLLIWGDRDKRASTQAGTALTNRIPGARIEVCEGCSHFPFQESAAHFAHLLERFCATPLSTRRS